MTDIEYPGTSPVVTELVRTPTDNAPPVTEEVKTEATAEAPPVVEPTETDKEQEKFASRFAALSRKEKELQQRERSFKESQAKLQAYEKALASAKDNPLEYLQAAGLTLEQALEQIINQDKEPTEQDRVQAIEKKIADYENQQKQLAIRAQEYKKQQELSQIHNELSTYVEQNSEQFELVKAYNAIPDVWAVIERTFIETKGQIHLTMEQACQAVEEQILEEKKLEADRLAKIKKLAKQTPLTSAGHVEDSNLNKVSKTVSPTLTNNSGTTSTVPKKFKTREESLAEAAKLLKWNEK